MAIKLSDIRQSLECRKGEKILLRANAGRQKMIEKTGVLAETYPSVFVVQLNSDGGRPECVSFSYADVLTETVKIVFEGEALENLA